MELRLRDLPDEAAIATDRYLEMLVAAGDRGALDSPSDALVDPVLRRVARRLRREMIRVHPSFRFEERLAATLRQAADARRLPVAAGGEGIVSTFPGSNDIAWIGFDPLSDGDDQGEDRLGRSRPIIIGGAVASAALSVAGAAIVAWHLSRGEADPMTRAVRAVNRLRAETARARLA